MGYVPSVTFVIKIHYKQKISCKIFAGIRKKLYFCSRNDKIVDKMLNHNAYFYGYYFYFATSCEAVGC